MVRAVWTMLVAPVLRLQTNMPRNILEYTTMIFIVCVKQELCVKSYMKYVVIAKQWWLLSGQQS